MKKPDQGEVWLVDLNPTQGHEQRGRRPGLIISVDMFNHGPAGLVMVTPMTTTDRGIPWHVQVSPPEGGLDRNSFILCDQLRTIDKSRLVQSFGSVEPNTLDDVQQRIRDLLGL